ncbi:MAG: AAA family ATPase [Saprospiraceae bacterium]|nr:AAA family ATPase [Saprospiraceae bacterium]
MAAKNINALLVGDWTFDEHWITGTHRIPTSSRTGEVHRFIHNEFDQEIINVSGAGRAASSILKSKDPHFKIFGMGAWEDTLEEIIQSFFTDYDKNRKYRNEFRLDWKFPKKDKTNSNEYPGEIKLYNINVLEDKVGSNRVIRIYDKVGDKVKLLERIDFIDNERLTGYEEKITEKITEELNKIEDDLALVHENIDIIIIKDMDHGIVTMELIELLIERYPPKDFDYFISSKNWKPIWFELFKNEKSKIKLMLITQIAAKTALKKFDCWMTPSGFITKEALELIKNHCEEYHLEKIVILPEKERVIAYDTKQETDIFIQTEFNDNYSEIDLPMASMFFPEIIKRINSDSIEFGQQVGLALNETVTWRKSLYNYIKYNKPRNPEESNKTEKFGKWRKVKYQKAIENWNLSFSLDKLGLRAISTKEIESNKKSKEFKNCIEKFEIWRAFTTLDAYICLSPIKKQKIRELLRSLMKEEPTKLLRSEVCFIKAAPGSGKSHLVKSLARVLGLEFLQFNLSQIHSNDQLLNCFDKINTDQAKSNDNKPLLVFFDEINSKVEGELPYSHFLAPLEDGYYMRNNHKFQLKPCIWVFVGTDFETGNKDKASDFKSRFTLPIIDLIAEKNELSTIRKEIINLVKLRAKIENKPIITKKFNTPNINNDQTQNLQAKILEINKKISELEEKKLEICNKDELLKLEKIYYCVAFIRSTFKQVTKVSKEVLHVFAMINPDTSIRDIRKFIESIKHIPYEEIRLEQIKQAIDVDNLSSEERINSMFSAEIINNIDELINTKKTEELVQIFDSPTKRQTESNYPIEDPK